MRRQEVMVTIRHARALGYCARGVRAWCARYGIDYRRLLADGVPADELIATGDELGRRVVEQAMQEAA